MNNCSNCDPINNCYGDIVYDGCVVSANSYSYLGIEEGDNYTTVLTKLQAYLQSISNIITTDDIVVNIENSCMQFSNDCLENLVYSYTTTLTTNGLNFSIDLSSFLASNNITNNYVVDIRVYDKNMVLLGNNVNNQVFLVLNSISNLLLPLTISINIYANINSSIIRLKSDLVLTLCSNGTFNGYMVCDNSNKFTGTLASYLVILNNKLCDIERRLTMLETE